MNLIEVSIEGMRQLAKNDSAGEGIDEHWEAVLPETYDIMANEIFLALYGRFINEPHEAPGSTGRPKSPPPRRE